jgi:hypothetical protein
MRILFLTLSALISTGLIVVAQESADDLQSLHEAVSKKDAAQVKTLAVKILETTKKVTAGPAPETVIDKEQVNQAREAQTYAEYALYSTAIASEPDVKLDLFTALEQYSPTSKYLSDGYAYYFQALVQTGGSSKIPAVAEKALKSLPSSPDVLDQLMNLAASKNQNDRAATYAGRLINALAKKSKSDIMPDAEWQKKRNSMLGRAHLVSGLILVAQDHNYRADQELRAALPLLKGDDVQTATALFNLSMANYKMGSVGMNKAQVLEAVKFSQQCAGIKSQFQEQAAHNVQAMKTYAAGMR